MKKEYRVKKEREFQKVFDEGSSVANRMFVIYWLPKEAAEHFRVGISVGKKIGNAVHRNRLKRLIRQCLHEVQKDLPENVDFLVIARPNAKNLSYNEVKTNLNHVLKLAGLL